MRAFLLVPLFALGCVPAGAVKPAGVKAEPVFAVEYDSLVKECNADPIAAGEKYDAGRVKMTLKLDDVALLKRGQVALIQSKPPITAQGKVDDLRAKPGDTVTVVGKLSRMDGRDKITLTDCRLE